MFLSAYFLTFMCQGQPDQWGRSMQTVCVCAIWGCVNSGTETVRTFMARLARCVSGNGQSRKEAVQGNGCHVRLVYELSSLQRPELWTILSRESHTILSSCNKCHAQSCSPVFKICMMLQWQSNVLKELHFWGDCDQVDETQQLHPERQRKRRRFWGNNSDPDCLGFKDSILRNDKFKSNVRPDQILATRVYVISIHMSWERWADECWVCEMTRHRQLYYNTLVCSYHGEFITDHNVELGLPCWVHSSHADIYITGVCSNGSLVPRSSHPIVCCLLY